MQTAMGVLVGILELVYTTGRSEAQEAADTGALMCLSGPSLAHDDARRIDHLSRVRELESAGDLVGAIVEAQRAAFDRPGAEEYEALARLAQRSGDRLLAAQALGALAGAMPESAEPLVRLARLFIDAGDSRGALEAATEATERDPHDAEAWHLKGRAEAQQGSLTQAIASFEQAVRLNPRHAWALNNLGYACLLDRNPQRAVAALERARELAPHLAYVHNNLGVAYEELGRLDEAQLAYGKALELEPDHKTAAAGFARMAETMGWAGPGVEAGTDAGTTDAGDSSEWSEEVAPSTAVERSWLFEAGLRSDGDDPSGADLRDEAPAAPPPAGPVAGRADNGRD